MTTTAGNALRQVPGWGSDDSLRPAPTRTFRLVTASNVRAREIVWMLPGRIPYSALSIVFGAPGQGKSQFTLALAAQLSRQGVDTVFIGGEDGMEDTIKPRLMAAGARLEHFHKFVVCDEQGRDDIPVLPTDAPLLEKAVRDKQAKLVIIDPLPGHLAPELNANSDHSLRQALMPLAGLAQNTGAAVVAVLHPRKGREGSTLERMGGGTAFGGAPRSVLLFGRRRADSKFTTVRYLSHVKANGAELAPTLELMIESVAVEENGRMIGSSAVRFGEETTQVTAEDLD